MKRNIFKFTMAIMLLCIMSVNGLAVYASAASISPRYTNCAECATNFYITSSGVAYTDITYYAYSGVFTQANISVKIQKKTFLFFWSTVDIGTSDDIWRTTSTDIFGDIVYTLQLSDTGTYRAVITVEFMGNTGVVDTIEETIEAKYS